MNEEVDDGFMEEEEEEEEGEKDVLIVTRYGLPDPVKAKTGPSL